MSFWTWGALIACVAAFVVAARQTSYENAARRAWFEASDCKPEGYAGKAPHRTYRCADGVLYVYHDMPLLKGYER